MPIRDNLRNTFKVKAETEMYSTNTAVSRGDLLHIIPNMYRGDIVVGSDENSKVYEVVTNVIGDDDTVDAIAIHTAKAGDLVECYVLVYRTKYKNMNELPHIILEQFTHEEIRKKKIKNNISKSCDSVSKVSCDFLSRYTCDNLNNFGVRKN